MSSLGADAVCAISSVMMLFIAIRILSFKAFKEITHAALIS
jgi:hypothetical protein